MHLVSIHLSPSYLPPPICLTCPSSAPTWPSSHSFSTQQPEGFHYNTNSMISPLCLISSKDFPLIFFFNIYLFGCTGSYLLHIGSLIFIAVCRIFFFFFSGMRNLVPWPEIKLRPPALGVQSLSQWTTEEVPPFLWEKRPRSLRCPPTVYMTWLHLTHCPPLSPHSCCTEPPSVPLWSEEQSVSCCMNEVTLEST